MNEQPIPQPETWPALPLAAWRETYAALHMWTQIVALDYLSPQELQIAQMAAEGMSNKEIGRQLYLSHRTVGSHLYRIFRKLGIAARSQLRSVLESGIGLPA